MSPTQNGSESDKIDLREDVIKVKEALAQVAEDVKCKAEELFHQTMHDAKSKSCDMQENIVNFVKEKPLTSIAISVVTGMILAKLLK